jgi:hypothetical protein
MATKHYLLIQRHKLNYLYIRQQRIDIVSIIEYNFNCLPLVVDLFI